MAKRGRPRKIKQREPNGRVKREGPRGPKRDEGTRQLRRIRAWFAQGGNPELTTYPLGILLANDQITEAQHRAACRYAWLHTMVFGRPSVAAIAWERKDPSVEPAADEEREKWLAALERRLSAVSELFRPQPALMRSVLHGLVISERIPRFMQPVFPRPSDCHEAELLREALTLLERHFGGALAKAA